MDDLELLNQIFEETLAEQEGLPFVARFRDALHAKRAVDFNLTAASTEQYDEVERIVRALTLRFRLTSLVEERRRAAQLSASAHPAAAPGPGSFDAALADLAAASARRQAEMPEFVTLGRSIEWTKSRQARQEISLSLATRLQERKDDISFRDQVRKDLAAYAQKEGKAADVKLDAALEQEKKEGPDYASKSKKISRIRDPLEDDDWPEYDIQLREAVRIAGDWVSIDTYRGQNILNVDTAALTALASAYPLFPLGVVPTPQVNPDKKARQAVKGRSAKCADTTFREHLQHELHALRNAPTCRQQPNGEHRHAVIR
mgnify:CR=1 FL=1